MQIWGSLELGVRLQALCCHCYPPMQTTLVCTFHGVLPNIKLSHTPMSSEKTHYSTVIIQGSTRFIVGDSIVLVIEPSNFDEPQICAGGFNDVFWWRLDAKNSRQAQSLAHSSLAPLLWMLQGRLMAPIQLDSITMLVEKLLVGSPDRYSVRSSEREILDCLLLLLCMKRYVVCDRLRFLHITLWYTKTTTHVLLCEDPTTLIRYWPHQNRQ